MVKDTEDAAGSKQAVKHVKDTLAKNGPDDEAIKKAVVERVTLENSDAKYVMSRLARYRQDQAKEITLGETNLEHIYPQNPAEDGWGGSENQEQMEPFTWHIGNLTIFGKKANRKAKNSEFDVKRPKYEQSKVIMTQEVAADYEQWNQATIKHRAAKLAKLVVQVWNFDNPSRV